jgi:hypothetical protein
MARAVGVSMAGGATVGVTARTIARTATAAVAGEAGAAAAFTARTCAVVVIGGAAEVAFMARTDATMSFGAAVVSIGAATTPAVATLAYHVVADEDILAVHGTMEFHLGGRSWFDLVPTNRACSDIAHSPPSYDEWPSSSG